MKNLGILTIILILLSCATQDGSFDKGVRTKWTETQKVGYNLILNQGGQTLGYSATSEIKILEDDGFAFKDLNQNGALDPYEDWRLEIDTRAKDLAAKLSIEEIAGLMLYSGHQSIPARSSGYFAGTYDGKPFENGITDPSDLTDQQKQFLKEDNLRHVLITTVESPEIAAQWNNKLQAYCESLGKGIPANNSSDPRHGTKAKAEYNAAAGGEISMWPTSLGMAATFDPGLVQRFGEIASIEYRALGITTALSPQVDIATDPRWARFSGTFGESPMLSASMGRAYCDGFQTSVGDKETAEGWGYESVNAMVKHWPGGGSGESGRDAHYGAGKYAVYPGNNFDAHMIPFTQGAFQLNGKTKMASAVMPYYTISLNQDKKNGENVGNAYNSYIINDLLRTKYNYDGVVCTDWGVTGDHKVLDSFIGGKPWGVESLSEAERHYKALMVGVDQFGGNNKAQPIIDAYQIGINQIGETKMRARMEQSAVRLLRNIFRVGVFENPYLDVEETKAVVGNPVYMKAGYEAQLKSIVLLKNQNNVLPVLAKKTVYMPKRFVPSSRNFLGMESPSSSDYPVSIDLVEKYFNVTDNPDQADLAFVFIQSPESGIGYDKADVEKGGNGYFPISLKYDDYTATQAREESLGGGDPLENFTNRSYKNKSTKTANITDAQLVQTTKREMKGKPVIVSINVSNPMVFSEIEKYASAILLNFGVQDQAILDMLSGQSEPSALLPMQMPKDMITVEKQAEDLSFDMDCHVDAEGNRYDFGFGMNWNGVIKDDRVAEYASGNSMNGKGQTGTYKLVVEGYDWGPAANKVILNLNDEISKVEKEEYTVTANKQAECNGVSSEATTEERTVVETYVSDANGNKIDKGNHVTLVMSVGPISGISSPMQYMPQCNGNVWADYKLKIEHKSTNQVWDTEVDRIHPLVDEFDISGRFVYNSEITLSYADYEPTIQQDKVPLIIWLHGGGEGGTDPTIPLLANRAANYASSEIQAYFGGAYVLVPQSPTFWMDKGNREYTRGDVNDRYNQSVMALIEAYVAEHQNIDRDRIYLGGCSNGGYMSLKLMLLHPDYFAASFPSALAYHDRHITDAQIESIKEMPIWFIHSKDDPVTKPEETVVPIYERLMAAGASNVHFSYYDHVVDITGLYGGDNHKYMGHFSWIYSHANHSKLDYNGQPVMINNKPVTIMEWLAKQRKSDN